VFTRRRLRGGISRNNVYACHGCMSNQSGAPVSMTRLYYLVGAAYYARETTGEVK
jgi:hypothetical protein